MSPRTMRRIQSFILFRRVDERPNVAVGIGHKGFRSPGIFPWLLSDFVSRLPRALHGGSHIINFKMGIHSPTPAARRSAVSHPNPNALWKETRLHWPTSASRNFCSAI